MILLHFGPPRPWKACAILVGHVYPHVFLVFTPRHKKGGWLIRSSLIHQPRQRPALCLGFCRNFWNCRQKHLYSQSMCAQAITGHQYISSNWTCCCVRRFILSSSRALCYQVQQTKLLVESPTSSTRHMRSAATVSLALQIQMHLKLEFMHQHFISPKRWLSPLKYTAACGSTIWMQQHRLHVPKRLQWICIDHA